MQIFEFHFNPKNEKHKNFDSFCYEPKNLKEQKLGNLYIVGEIVNTPSCYESVQQYPYLKILDDLAETIKKYYYQSEKKLKLNPEKSLKQALEQGNNFLKNQIKNLKANLQNNLDFAVLSLSEITNNQNKEKWELNFAKNRNTKIFLIRQGQILDIGKNIEQKKTNSSVVLASVSDNKILTTKKFFSNIATGQVYKNDIIIILTEQIFSICKKENILEQICSFASATASTDEIKKAIKKTLQKRKKIFTKTNGVFLLIVLGNEKEYNSISCLKKGFSLPAIFPKMPLKNFSSLKNFAAKIKFAANIFLDRLLLFRQKISLFSFIEKTKKVFFSRNCGLIIILIFILACGSFIFNQKKQTEIKKAEQNLNQIEEQIIKAENFLIIQEENKANLLLQQAWKNVLPFTKSKNSLLKERSVSLKKSIESYLDPVNKIQRIQEPVLSQNFDESQFISKKISDLKSNIIKNNSGDFENNILCDYNSNLYSLNPLSGEIIKYSLTENMELGEPKIWISSELLKNAKAMAIDGNIWVLNNENKLDRYFVSAFQETMEFNFFPEMQDPEKIWTSSKFSYIYILEPNKNRIVVLKKNKGIKKQFISAKFDNLLDFAVSEKEDKIWVLNNSDVYEIEM